MMRTGIYTITCTTTSKQYVGSAQVLKQRFYTHRSLLRRGKHHSRHLQRAWDKHGEATFVFAPIVYCSSAMLLEYEQRALDVLRPAFNIAVTAGSQLGLTRSDAQRARHLSAAVAYGAQRARKFSVRGEMLSVGAIAEKYKLPKDTVYRRIAIGRTGEGIIAPLEKQPRTHLVRGEQLTVTALARKYGLSRNTVRVRAARGKAGDALVAPAHKVTRRG